MTTLNHNRKPGLPTPVVPTVPTPTRTYNMNMVKRLEKVATPAKANNNLESINNNQYQPSTSSYLYTNEENKNKSNNSTENSLNRENKPIDQSDRWVDRKPIEEIKQYALKWEEAVEYGNSVARERDMNTKHYNERTREFLERIEYLEVLVEKQQLFIDKCRCQKYNKKFRYCLFNCEECEEHAGENPETGKIGEEEEEDPKDKNKRYKNSYGYDHTVANFCSICTKCERQRRDKEKCKSREEEVEERKVNNRRELSAVEALQVEIKEQVQVPVQAVQVAVQAVEVGVPARRQAVQVPVPARRQAVQVPKIIQPWVPVAGPVIPPQVPKTIQPWVPGPVIPTQVGKPVVAVLKMPVIPVPKPQVQVPVPSKGLGPVKQCQYGCSECASQPDANIYCTGCKKCDAGRRERNRIEQGKIRQKVRKESKIANPVSLGVVSEISVGTTVPSGPSLQIETEVEEGEIPDHRYLFVTLTASPDWGRNEYLRGQLLRNWLKMQPASTNPVASAYVWEYTEIGTIHLHGLIRYAAKGMGISKSRKIYSNYIQIENTTAKSQKPEGKKKIQEISKYDNSKRVYNTRIKKIRKKWIYITKWGKVIGDDVSAFL